MLFYSVKMDSSNLDDNYLSGNIYRIGDMRFAVVCDSVETSFYSLDLSEILFGEGRGWLATTCFILCLNNTSLQVSHTVVSLTFLTVRVILSNVFISYHSAFETMFSSFIFRPFKSNRVSGNPVFM